MESKANQRDLVIKVKYGDSLKRFTASFNNSNQLNETIATLWAKIISTFNFTPTTEFVLTYTDTDGDTVMLDDDNDLHDAAVCQKLNPLRITVHLKSNGSPSSEPTPQNLFVGVGSSLEEAFKSLPEPLNNTLSKVTEEIVSKATSAPVLAELLNVFSKLTVPTEPTPAHPVNNDKVSGNEPKVSSDKGESSNARESHHSRHYRTGKGVMPTPPPSPFLGPPFPPFSPMCRSGRIPDPPSRFFPSGHPYRKVDGLESFSGVHVGIRCDGCDLTPIVGPRYKSTVKEEYNLCSACFYHMGNQTEYTRIDQPVTHHRWIQCDGCDVIPIVGIRYKSVVKENYDLCSKCFSQMGNETDYTRIERPLPPHRILRDFHTHPRYGGPSVTCPMRSKRSKLESRFIQDVTVLDGTLMAPLTPFTKIWRMRNNGSTIWPYGTQLVWVGGDQFSSLNSTPLEVPVNGFPVDEEIDVAVDFCAPARAGRYVSYWRLASPSGQKFGQRVWVLIQVEQPNSTEANLKSSINLNLPPESSMADGTEMIDMNVDPTVENEFTPKPETVVTPPESIVTQSVPVETVPEPIATQPEPITGHAPSPLGSYPLIDLSPSSSNATLVDTVPVEVVYDKKTEADEEETLLKELEQMGFKQVDLNKEVLRLNKYDLDQSVEDLCGFSEWDPLLEELKEMGFIDKEENKKLLVKNGGSIKRVVMDLVKGEKAE